MTPLDYAASYFQFLAGREEANPPEDESEDVCFCCKDGGEVIECDWKGLNNKFVRCPKVYHEGTTPLLCTLRCSVPQVDITVSS